MTAALRPRGRPRKTTWPPCAVCGDPDGRIAPGCRTPSRYGGYAYGIDGEVCFSCIQTLRQAAGRRRRAALEAASRSCSAAACRCACHGRAG